MGGSNIVDLTELRRQRMGAKPGKAKAAAKTVHSKKPGSFGFSTLRHRSRQPTNDSRQGLHLRTRPQPKVRQLGHAAAAWPLNPLPGDIP
jgi:hypothetical protein